MTQEELRDKIDKPVFHLVGEAADSLGRDCYVVGGYVRDLMLGRHSKDIDFLTVGSGIEVAQEVARTLRGSHLAVYRNFGTAQVKNRNYRFIIYMDDLSFEEFEIEYKYLKAVIEGGLERRPENVLIYATSNRRHLIREKFSDKRELDDELHSSDTVQEKLSLVARFGVTIYFGKPDKKQFQEIVRQLAKKNGIDMPEDDLLLEANKWELSHGGLSGRTAQQFIDYLAGTGQREEM